MKKLLLAATLFTAVALPGAATAQVVDDPLQGVCVTCVEVGGVVTQLNGSLQFGFRADPTQGGDLTIVFLVPNIAADAAATPRLMGFAAPTLQGSVFNAGSLQTFLGISGNPANPVASFETAFEDALVPGIAADGFRVFTLDVGVFASICNCSTPSDFFTEVAGSLPLGTEIVGILNTGTANVFTAPSGSLEVNTLAAPVPGPIVGAGLPGLISSLGGLLWLARRRRSRNAAA